MAVRRGLVRDAMASAVLVGVLLAVALGIPAVDRKVPGLRTLPPGVPYLVGAGIELTPPEGALLDVSRSRPGPRQGRAVLMLANGRVRCLVVVSAYEGSLGEATLRLRNRLVRVAGVRLGTSIDEVRTAAGVVGHEGRYVPFGERPGSEVFDAVQPNDGELRSGRFAVFLIAGRSVEVTVVGPNDALRAVDRSVDECLGTLTERKASRRGRSR